MGTQGTKRLSSEGVLGHREGFGSSRAPECVLDCGNDLDKQFFDT